jgi:hypothetical protein
MKKCIKCQLSKQLDLFNKNSRSKDGLTSYCKECAKESTTLWVLANKPKRKKNQAVYYKRNSKELKEKQVFYRESEEVKTQTRSYGFAYNLKKYGLTPETYYQTMLDQNNRCYICEKEFIDKIKPVIDHCHTYNYFRGILCNGCNMGLGHLEKFLEKAITYLNKYGTS